MKSSMRSGWSKSASALSARARLSGVSRSLRERFCQSAAARSAAPCAYMAALMAPMDVPYTLPQAMPSSSSARIAPIW